jgi:ribose transport system ATP-binding protein
MGQESGQLLRVAGVSKSFPGVQALSSADFTLRGGEVHGLVGENGAGKSTLIKILMGAYQMDSGAVFMDGKPVSIHSPIDARNLGLNAVYQDMVIAPELTVGENFFIGKLPTRLPGLIDWRTVHAESKQTLQSLGIDVDPRKRIADLSPGEQAMVTIAKIVREKAHLVIFDEPTARLTTEETQKLFDLIAHLKEQNIGIIYISHRLEEIFEICDTVTVLRDGHVVGSYPISEVNEDRLIAMMVGRTIEEMYNIRHVQPGEVLLEVRGLAHEPLFRNVSFTLRRGEVLGLFGLVGARRTELLRTIFGADTCTSGEIRVRGRRLAARNPAQTMASGVGLVPEERKLQGLAMPLSVKHNVNIASYGSISVLGFVRGRKETERTRRLVDELNIRTPSLDQIVANLSGGNQQKVAIAKWLCRDADILILDEPTTGVDVGAKVEIYRLIESVLQAGKAVIVCSSYLPEVIGLADRILVMAEGEITGEVQRQDANEETLLRLASKFNHAAVAQS